MQNFFDFFLHPLILPVYIGLAMYGFAWLGLRFFAAVFAKQLESRSSAIERGTIRAGRLVIILHLFLETVFVAGLCIHALPRVSDWSHTLLYLIPYAPFLITDVFILISLSSHSINSKKDGKSKTTQ